MANAVVFQADMYPPNQAIQWAGYTSRAVIDLTPVAAIITSPGYQAQVRIQYSSGDIGWDIAETFIGNKSPTGNPWLIENSSPTRVTFGGGNSASLAPRTTMWSDWISFGLNKSGAGLVITVYTAPATNDQSALRPYFPGLSLWYTFGNEAGISQPASAYTDDERWSGIAAIEMDGFGTPSRLVRLQSWYYGPTGYHIT